MQLADQVLLDLPARRWQVSRIPRQRLLRDWQAMKDFQPLRPGAKPIVLEFRHPTEWVAGQSLADWFAAQSDAGRVVLRNPPALPSRVEGPM